MNRKKKRRVYDRCSICDEKIKWNHRDENTYDLCFDCHNSVEDSVDNFEILTGSDELLEDDFYIENNVMHKYIAYR